MGYSVYVKLEPTERMKVRLFLKALVEAGHTGPSTADENGVVRPDALFGQYTSDPRMENLSYCGEPDGTYVGCDYGVHDIAHTFVNWMAKTLGYEEFSYDDEKMLPVKEDKVICDIFIRSGREDDWTREYLAMLERIVDVCQGVWDELSTNENNGND